MEQRKKKRNNNFIGFTLFFFNFFICFRCWRVFRTLCGQFISELSKSTYLLLILLRLLKRHKMIFGCGFFGFCFHIEHNRGAERRNWKILLFAVFESSNRNSMNNNASIHQLVCLFLHSFVSNVYDAIFGRTIITTTSLSVKTQHTTR